MSKYDVTMSMSQHLTDGYSVGAHVSGPGWSGHYVIRESDGASIVARVTPETLDDVDLDEAFGRAARERVREAEERAARDYQDALERAELRT